MTHLKQHTQDAQVEGIVSEERPRSLVRVENCFISLPDLVAQSKLQPFPKQAAALV